jgi:hypothetical protein
MIARTAKLVNYIRPRSLLKTAKDQTHLAWQIATPKRTHMRPARCEESDCPHYLKGWVTTVDEGSPQAGYIRYMSGRQFSEQKLSDGRVQFLFVPGQECFREHWKKLDRGPWLFVVQGKAVSPEYGGFAHLAESQSQDWDDWRDQMNEEVYQYQRHTE